MKICSVSLIITEMQIKTTMRYCIALVRVEKDNTLVFCFSDGMQSVKQWQNRSRHQSWTPEMKEAARMMEYEYAALLRDQIIELRGTK